ncbi:hypothetical protein [Natronobacterium lacisalsi]|uniref:hypothetical protein n=1 Tax=Natronobacterium lacisalsi TaxID=229731 RepID=UPI0012691B7D|nr:hypothetical protein [Halobiforma lacisalsi]
MDEREYREQPVAQPTGQWMVPSDRMILHRYKSMEHFDSVLENGFRAARAEDHERREGRASKPTREYEMEEMQLEVLKA